MSALTKLPQTKRRLQIGGRRYLDTGTGWRMQVCHASGSQQPRGEHPLTNCETMAMATTTASAIPRGLCRTSTTTLPVKEKER